MDKDKKRSAFVRMIDALFAWRERRIPVRLRRRTYLLTALFLGWCGGHRFLARQYALGVIYAVLFWTGIPIAMTLIDLMIALPLPADAEGYITV